MRTIFVTGSDTGIGKTRVAAAVARLLWKPNLRVQFIKPVETGRDPGDPGDADEASRESGIRDASVFTLIRFSLPLAPLAAGRAQGADLSVANLVEQWAKLPAADLRIIEGAGGIAVPIDADGRDWCAFVEAIRPDRVVLVTPDRLGGINQARLLTAYAKDLPVPAGLWLNEGQDQAAEIRRSNREGLAGLPLWATQRFNAPLPEDPEAVRVHLTGVVS